MKRTGKTLRGALALLLCAAALLTVPALGATAAEDFTVPMLDARELREEWKRDQVFTLVDVAPWDLTELQRVVDVEDPRSVAAYWVWAVNRLVDDYDDGMGMMKYLFADIEPMGRGFTEGGLTGRAGWDTYFNERLKSDDYRWLPRAYFDGANVENGFKPTLPLTLELYYNDTNTETVNAQSLDQLGRLNIVYWVKSYAGGNQVNIVLSKFEGSDRWYVTSGASSNTLFYDQRSVLGKDFAEQQAVVKRLSAIRLDDSTAAEHEAFYSRPITVTVPVPAPAPEPEPEPQDPEGLPRAPAPEVVLSPQKLAVNGETKATEIYNIGGTNYFKIRDLAALLNGTGAQFNVGYDAGANAVVVTTGEAYEANGSELQPGEDKSATAVPSPQSILIDGKNADLAAWNIGGTNFFGLRALQPYLGYEVGFDAAANTAQIIINAE